MTEKFQKWKIATTLPSLKISLQEKMLCDYIQERCVGEIISLPAHAPDPVDGTEGALVPYVPYVYDPNTLVDAACEAAVVLASVEVQPLRLAHRNHTFYQELKGDLHRRFLMVSDENRQWKLAVKKLELCGRAGGAGIFRRTGRIEYLDLKECLAARSVQKFLEDLHV